MRTDAVNLDIRRHEEKKLDATSWEHSEEARELYRFFDLFNQRFFNGKLPTPVISFRSGRVTSLGWYHIGRNEFGVLDSLYRR